jgi:accessory colonization factor AcfC
MGAALAGSPTCYVYRNGKKVPVVAGESVRWVEVAPKPIDNVFYARESTSRFYSLLKENDK